MFHFGFSILFGRSFVGSFRVSWASMLLCVTSTSASGPLSAPAEHCVHKSKFELFLRLGLISFFLRGHRRQTAHQNISTDPPTVGFRFDP